jgi:hypothetical protein
MIGTIIGTLIVIIVFTPLFLAVLFSYEQQPHVMDKAWDWIRKSVRPPRAFPPPNRTFNLTPLNAKHEHHAQQHEEWDVHFRALLAQSWHVSDKRNLRPPGW